jgi:asparagine N-glycosylation enzyme membrane subunit Stt3
MYFLIAAVILEKYGSYLKYYSSVLVWPWVLLVLMSESLQKILKKYDGWLITAAVMYVLNLVFWVGFVIWKAVN